MRRFNLLDISIYQIQIFLMVAEERNFSRTAALVNLTQPALSKRISALENTVGMPLFQREKRPITLTPEGECLYGLWRDIARTVELSLETARAISRPSRQTLTAGIIDTGNLQSAIPLIGMELAQELPGFFFHWEYVSFADWRGRLMRKEIDIAFTLLMEADYLSADFAWEKIAAFPKLVCMLKTNPLSKKKSITFEDLKNQRFVALSPAAAPVYHKFVKAICNRHGFEPNIVRYTSDAHDLIPSLHDDDDVVVCDKLLRNIKQPFLKAFELPDTPNGLIAVWREGDANPLIPEYLRRLHQNLEADMPAGRLKRKRKPPAG